MVNYATFQKEWDEAVGEHAAGEFEQWKRCSEMLRQLQILRIDSGRTEEDIANILGWTEDQVLAFEMSEVQDIHLGNLLAYLEAIDFGMGIRFINNKAPVMEKIEFHASKIHDLFKEIVEMAGDEKKMTKKALELIYAYNQMFTNMAVNLTTMFPNQSAVTKALEKILPPEFRPSRSTKKSNTGLSDYEAPFVAGEVVLNSPSG